MLNCLTFVHLYKDDYLDKLYHNIEKLSNEKTKSDYPYKEVISVLYYFETTNEPTISNKKRKRKSFRQFDNIFYKLSSSCKDSST